MHSRASVAGQGAMPTRARPPVKRVLLAQPRGYCAGVDRAVEAVERALVRYGRPVYVRNEIVHNQHVVTMLRERGVVFVKDTDEVPPGAVMMFSAHGVSPAVRAAAKRTRGGTCGEAPNHVQVIDGTDSVDDVVVRDESKVVWLSQTTLSVDETLAAVERLRHRFPLLQDPPSDDICYATQNRQAAVKALAPQCDLVIVVGSHNSSNSVRLVEVARRAGVSHAYRVDHAGEIDLRWLDDVSTVGVTSGASVPEILVRDVLTLLADNGFTHVQPVHTAEETVVFAPPRELRK